MAKVSYVRGKTGKTVPEYHQNFSTCQDDCQTKREIEHEANNTRAASSH